MIVRTMSNFLKCGNGIVVIFKLSCLLDIHIKVSIDEKSPIANVIILSGQLFPFLLA